MSATGYLLSPAIWKEAWGFDASEIELVRPIACALDRCGYRPSLERANKINKDHFHSPEAWEQFKEWERHLVERGISLQSLYRLIEPAILFHELWLYQLNLLEDTSPRAKGIYKNLHHHVRTIIAPSSPISKKLKQALREDFEDNTASSTGLSWLSLDWSPAQCRFLRAQMGEPHLNGEQRHPHRAAYWRKAFKVLTAYLVRRKHFKKYRAVQTVYFFSRLVFPAAIEQVQTPLQRRDFVRRRLRYTPKVGSRL